MKKIVKWVLSQFPEIHLEKDNTRIHTQFIIIFFALSIISLFMTFLNYLTNWYGLAKLTLLLAIVCAISLLIENYSKKRILTSIGRTFFAVMICVVFALFAINGEPEGFSILWALMMPSCGFILFRSKYGFIISTILFTVIAVLFWTPVGDLLLADVYTVTFKQRFPIIYAAFFIVGYIFEFIRSQTQTALVKAKEQYEYLHNHDMLTGLYNRYGFNSSFDDFIEVRNGVKYSFAILDVDHFKNVNDTYGHQAGDIVLKEVANRINKNISSKCIASRWGGEEFSILFKDEDEAINICNQLIDNQRKDSIQVGSEFIYVYVSIGIVDIDVNEDAVVSEVVKKADNNLYKAKETGRNKMIHSKYSD